MTFSVSTQLLEIFEGCHKNCDMALMTLLDSLDNNTYQGAFSSIDSFSLAGEKTEITIGVAVIKQIKQAFQYETISDQLINELLWIAVLLPEV